MHSIVHRYGPEALHNTWTTNLERNPNLLLRNANDLYVPRARTDHTKKLPYFALSNLWNDLPDLKLTPNPVTFKILIKEHFSNAI
jgi:hypothetical protein